jgi:hypothetical protein
VPVPANLADQLAAAVADIYTEAETALLRLVTDRLARNVDAPSWAVERLGDVQALQRTARAIVGRLERAATPAMRLAVLKAYAVGHAAAVADVADVWATGQRGANKQVRRQARMAGMDDAERSLQVQALARALVEQAQHAHRAVLPAITSAYRQAIAGAAARQLAGGIPQRQAAQAAWQALTDKGITGFTDAAGRRWRLSTYVEMGVRTAAARAAAQAAIDAAEAAGRPLLVVDDRPGECVLCRPWEHKVLTIGGPVGPVLETDPRTGRLVAVDVAGTVEQAMAAGLLHPNCRHALRPWGPALRLNPGTSGTGASGNRVHSPPRPGNAHSGTWRRGSRP